MIQVVLGDLAEQTADGVVRAVASDFAPINAASRDVVLAAGRDLEERLEKIGALPVGGAVLTPSGRLPSAFLIHVVVMSDDEPQTSMSVQKALQNGLRRASDWGLESLALPALGIVAGTIEPEISARALVDILFNHIDEGDPPLDLTIVVASEFESDLFSRLIAAVSRDRGPSGTS